MYYTHIYWYRKPSLSCAGVSCVWADDCNKIVVACGLPGTHWDTLGHRQNNERNLSNGPHLQLDNIIPLTSVNQSPHIRSHRAETISSDNNISFCFTTYIHIHYT